MLYHLGTGSEISTKFDTSNRLHRIGVRRVAPESNSYFVIDAACTERSPSCSHVLSVTGTSRLNDCQTSHSSSKTIHIPITNVKENRSFIREGENMLISSGNNEEIDKSVQEHGR